jgi:hypothetical protein
VINSIYSALSLFLSADVLAPFLCPRPVARLDLAKMGQNKGAKTVVYSSLKSRKKKKKKKKSGLSAKPFV